MTEIAIRVQDLSKQYHIGRRIDRHATLRDQLADASKGPVRWLRRNGHSPSADRHPDSIWALEDVSFEIERGEIVGIIGRNGAGKSTLLKILSRITEPTRGCADIYGRVGSLLEVGTGFHAELTGRENIYLNGAILGMKRSEIHRKFDEIVSFAEIEQFIDTPVKRYSSGMYVRLAFAVAAHLEPDILLVDEVLAVGDAAFQKKCLGRMGDVAKEGRTVLFVSHDMAAILSLCRRVLLLKSGRVISDGSSASVVGQYLSGNEYDGAAGMGSVQFGRPRKSDEPARFVRVQTANPKGEIVQQIECGADLVVDLELESARILERAFLDFVIKDESGRKVALVSSYFSYNGILRLAGPSSVRVEIKRVNLLPGRYGVDIMLHLFSERVLCEENAIYFDIVASDYYGTGKLPPRSLGLVCFPCSWSFRESAGSVDVTFPLSDENAAGMARN